MTQGIRIKICCVSSTHEANLAVQYGASAIGLVGNMPSGPGIIEDSLIRRIAGKVPPGVSTFLLTSHTTPDQIIEHYERTRTSAIQIVDKIEGNHFELIRKSLPHIKLIQVIHVLDNRSIDEALEASEGVDALLLDSGNPNLPIKELGGTGRVHDWKLSRKIREMVSVPVFLAGGINKENVQDAIEFVQPFGIDLCSSVRTEGKLDERKLEEFFRVLH